MKVNINCDIITPAVVSELIAALKDLPQDAKIQFARTFESPEGSVRVFWEEER